MSYLRERHTTIELICDRCGKKSNPYRDSTVREMRHCMRTWGWTANSSCDLCPTCVEAVKTEVVR